MNIKQEISVNLDSKKLNQIHQDLAEKQWCIVDQLFSETISFEILEDIKALDLLGKLTPAHIRRQHEKIISNKIRGDRILWLNETDLLLSACHQNIFNILIQLRKSFSQEFYLSLKKIEFHYALYPPESHYDKHLDQHAGQKNRIITLVHYLNPNWIPAMGGRLLVYQPSTPTELAFVVEPKLGRTVLFLSDIFPHRVEFSTQPRMSLTGWFRND